MIRLYGYKTQNSMKTLYVLEESELSYEFQLVDLAKGEQRTAEFIEKAQMRKVPLLEHDGEFLFESGAICRYVGDLTESSLYPLEKMPRARVDQWMDFFSCGLGRMLTTQFYEKIVKPKFGLGEPDANKLEEADNLSRRQMKILNLHLANTDFLANDQFSVADLFAFAYVEQCAAIGFPLADFPNVLAWSGRIEARDCVARARAVF